MSNKELFNQKEFPEWEGCNTTDEKTKFVKELWLNDIDLMAKSLHEIITEKEYFKKMLLYIQRKLDLDEPLGLCLNSAKEVFGIMITPCDTLNDEGKELTLDDYDDILEYTIGRDFADYEMRDCMKCKVCGYVTYETIDKSEFENHNCI